MNAPIKFAGLTFILFLLAACEQPAPEAQQAEETAATETVYSSSADVVTSIDADGNVAPFGMASRQPVPVADPEPAAAQQPVMAANDGGSASSDLYNVHCIACHGSDAKGVQGLGLSLVDSELVASSSKDELTAFLKAGRAADAPDSVTKVPMPGFAWMGDAELAEITGYLKSL
ncbi:MAG: c-type cytochrome [Gammaproteobacteria bacterium]